MSQFAALTVDIIFKFSVLPDVTGTSTSCDTIIAPVCPDVVPMIAPIEKSCDPLMTEFPSQRTPTAKSPVPTGQDIERTSFFTKLVPAGTIKLRFESPKLDVKVTGLVVKVWPLAVRVIYCVVIISHLYFYWSNRCNLLFSENIGGEELRPQAGDCNRNRGFLAGDQVLP